MRLKRVCGVAFIKDDKLLVVQSVRSSKTGSYTLVGGGVLKGEKVIDGAIRECKEELGKDLELTRKDLAPLLCFKEKAASDPRIMIEMTIFISLKEIDIDLIPNKEILDYKWYDHLDEKIEVSSSISEHFVPYAIEKNILHWSKKVLT